MAHISFTKISEHNAIINNVSTVIWEIATDTDIAYVQARYAHSKLGNAGYWTDARYIINKNSIKIVDETFESVREIQMSNNDPTIYQQVECGQCGRVNLIDIDNPKQGSHTCVSCRGTIAIITGNRMNLKNGSTARNTQRGK